MRAQQSEWSNCWNLALSFLSSRLGTRLGRWVTLHPRTQSLLLQCSCANPWDDLMSTIQPGNNDVCPFRTWGWETTRKLVKRSSKSIGIVRTNQKHDTLPALWFGALSIVAPLAVTMGWLGRIKAWNFWVLPPVPSLFPFK